MGTSEMLAKNIKKLLESRGISPSQLSKASGIDKTILSRILSGKTTNPQVETLKPIAEYFCISIDQLIGASPIPDEHAHGIIIPVKRLLVPLIDWKNIAYWDDIKNNFKPKITFEVSSHISSSSFALKILDTKFEPRISKNTIIIVDPTLEPNDRDYVILEEIEKTNKNVYNQFTINQFIISEDKKFLKTICDNIEITPLKKQEKFFGVIIEAFIKMESGILE